MNKAAQALQGVVALSIVVLGLFFVFLSPNHNLSSVTGKVTIQSLGIDCTDPVDGMNITNTTLLCPGTFNLPSGINIVNTSIIVECNETIITGTNGVDLVGINATDQFNVTIRNCNVQNYKYGMFLSNVSGSTIFNNSILDNNASGSSGIGLYLSGFSASEANLITTNIFERNDLGIDIFNSTYNVIFNNTIFNNTGGITTFIANSTNITYNNITRNSGGALTLAGLDLFDAGASVAETFVFKNIISFNGADGIGITVPGTMTVANNTITNNTGDGIDIENSNVGLIQVGGKIITGNLIAFNGGNGIICGNSIPGSLCTSNTISNNNISYNLGSGIFLSTYSGFAAPGSGSNTITGNTLVGNEGSGILGDNSLSNTISNNFISNSSNGMLFLSPASDPGGAGNVITNNVITNVTNGIIFQSNNGNTNALNNNNISSSTSDIISGGNTLSSLTFTVGANQLTFYPPQTLNVNHLAGSIFINTSVAAVNSTAEPGLNITGNIQFDVDACPVGLFENESFSMNPRSITIPGAQFCQDCVISSCSSNQLFFSKTHWSTVAADPEPTVISVILNSTFGTNLTDENLTVSFNSSDPTGQNVINITDWRINGSSLAVLNMPFEADGGTNAKDYSSYNNNGTPSIDINSKPEPIWTPNGYIGGAYNWSGDIHGPVNISYSTSFALHNFTVSAWFKIKTYPVSPSGIITTRVLSNFGGDGGDTFDLKILQVSGSENEFAVDIGDYAGWLINTDGCHANLNLDTWYNIVYAVHNGGYESYFNGTMCRNETFTGEPLLMDSSQAMFIGRSLLASEFMNGSIDEVIIYNRTLSRQQIRENYVSYLSGHNPTTLSSQETNVTDIWSACVTPNDGLQNGQAVCSNNVRIVAPIIPNVLPVAGNVTVRTISGVNNTNENLTVTFTSSDANGDSVRNITDWRVSNRSLALFYLPFEGGSDSSSTRDYTSFNRTVVGFNTPIWNISGGFDGHGAYQFGTSFNTYLQVTIPATVFRNFTYVLWAKPTSFSSFSTFIDDNHDNQWLGLSGSSLTIYGRCGQTSFGTLSSGVWQHLAWAVNGSDYRVYKNGVLVGSGSGCTIAASATSLRIGSDIFNEDIEGFIDEVRVYNRSLSEEQIIALYQNKTNLISPEETDLGENWSACVTPNDGIGDGATKCSNTVTITNLTPPTPSPGSTGGGGGGGNQVYFQHSPGLPHFPAPPVTETPSPVLMTSIDPLMVSLNSFACSSTSKVPASVPQSDASIPSSSIKSGYDILVPSFKLDCMNESVKLTLSLPDSYENVTALRCSGESCSPIDITQTSSLSCAVKIFEDVRRTSAFLPPELFPIELTKAESQPGEASLQSSKTIIKFIGDTKGKVTLDKLFDPAPEATNQRIRIVGTPTVLSFENNPGSIATNITLPYVLPEHVDESSVAIYALKDSKWSYIGGDVDKNTKTVTATIHDISQYSQNNKLTIATMGLICLNCVDSKLDKVYDGGSRDAVILIHGFENTPERFEDVINDMKLTKQPWQAWTFGYPSNMPIETNAKDLADLLQAHSSEYDVLYITAHSLGGLIAQDALNYAYQQNMISRQYTFIDKVRKVVLIATPNKGALTQDPNNLFNELINNDVVAGLFNIKSDVVKELINGKQVPRVPGIDYSVIAGTLPYKFSGIFNIGESNDGLVSISSAQTIGGELVNNYCSNFWSINTTHTDILNNFQSRKIVERIVAKEVADSLPDKPLLGHNQYYDMNIPSCSPNDKYLVVGVLVSKEAAPNPGLCSCGNKVCGIDENQYNCPSDCAMIEQPKASIWDLLLRFAPLRNLLIGLITIILAIVILARHRGKEHFAEVIVPQASLGDGEREKLLNELIIKTRISLRLGEYDNAAISYSRFSNEFNLASQSTKDKFADVSEKLKEQVREKIR